VAALFLGCGFSRPMMSGVRSQAKTTVIPDRAFLLRTGGMTGEI
jgi:hypothetical protein